MGVGNQALFALGELYITQNAADALEQAGQPPTAFLLRHIVGDWGELDAEDRATNDEAVATEGRILSAYTTTVGEKVWVITEGDRSATTLLLPDDY